MKKMKQLGEHAVSDNDVISALVMQKQQLIGDDGGLSCTQTTTRPCFFKTAFTDNLF